METRFEHSQSPRQQEEGQAEQVTDGDTSDTSDGLRLKALAMREGGERTSTERCSSLNTVDLGHLASSCQQPG